MNRQTNNTRHWLLEQIERNLFAIVAGAVVIYTTTQTAATVTAKDIEAVNKEVAAVSKDIAAINKRLDAHEEKLRDRRGFMGCAVRSLDKISEKTGVALPCDLNLPE